MNQIVTVGIVVLFFLVIPTIQLISDYANSRKFSKAINKMLALEAKIDTLITKEAKNGDGI